MDESEATPLLAPLGATGIGSLTRFVATAITALVGDCYLLINLSVNQNSSCYTPVTKLPE